jgi:DNA-binding LacI/PurR family transcriptional regulator
MYLSYFKVLYKNRVDGIVILSTGKCDGYLNFPVSSAVPVTFVDRSIIFNNSR